VVVSVGPFDFIEELDGTVRIIQQRENRRGGYLNPRQDLLAANSPCRGPPRSLLVPLALLLAGPEAAASLIRTPATRPANVIGFRPKFLPEDKSSARVPGSASHSNS
jgi:hypothetical protein